uniref:Uncharacterized protein n=1 Tax=Octopus bimaculoides TaxID=37653 RepID=A0A0L8FUX8_OCTBM
MAVIKTTTTATTTTTTKNNKRYCPFSKNKRNKQNTSYKEKSIKCTNTHTSKNAGENDISINSINIKTQNVSDTNSSNNNMNKNKDNNKLLYTHAGEKCKQKYLRKR